MPSDWLDDLNQIREDDKAKLEEVNRTLDSSLLDKKNSQAKSIHLLAVCDAHNSLRKMNRVLLDGKGIIDIFDTSEKYDRVMTLVWQGPVSAARPPSQNDASDAFYIMVGAKDDKIFVNGKALKGTTPEALKAALVNAARKPARKAAKK
jgi:hypothetical protein